MKDINANVKKSKVLGAPEGGSLEEFCTQPVDVKLELIRALVPLGLQAISDMLEQEISALAGAKHSRGGEYYRHGSNPGSVKLAGQRHAIRVPRVRERGGEEVKLSGWQALKGDGETDEVLLRRVLYGISTRRYEAAAEALPGSIGLSKSTISRAFIKTSSQQLKAFESRDLSCHDIIGLIIDGKTFAEDTMVVALGVKTDGSKILLGIEQTATENGRALTQFFQRLMDRGLKLDQGMLVVIDGSKGLRSAVNEAFGKRALVQRCQWHKRENVVCYLPKNQQAHWRKRLQRAYEKPTYKEAKKALLQLRKELELLNESAVRSLDEGFEETLTLHRLDVFTQLGRSLKTTNCLESINAQIEVRCRNVKRWKNSKQKKRWLAASLIDIEPKLRKIQGYKNLPLLRQAIIKDLGLNAGVIHKQAA